jgi:hypothetical protein
MRGDMDEKKFLKGEQILAINDIKTQELFIPDWDSWVRVRTMSGAEYDRYQKSILIGKGKNRDVNLMNARAKLVALTVVDENGQRLFTDSQITALGQKSSAAIGLIFDLATDLAGITEEDVEELVDELQENPFDGSASA